MAPVIQRQFSGSGANQKLQGRVKRMTKRIFGTAGKAPAARVSRATMAFALAAGMTVPASAQTAETPTPAPSSSTRPIDFRLTPPEEDGRASGVQGPANNGLPPVTPGERRTPTPAPTPAPTPPPRVTPTRPAAPAAAAAPTERRATPPAATPPVVAPRNTAPASDPAPTPSATDAIPGFTPAPAPTDATGAGEVASVAAPADDAAPVPAAPAGNSGTPLWAWLLAVLAAGAAGFWYWRRRPVPANGAPLERSAAPAIPPRDPAPRPAAPRPATPAPPRPAPKAAIPPGALPAPSPLVTRPADERRALISLALEVQAIRLTPEHVAVAFTLNLANMGSCDATGLMVRIALNQGSAMREQVLARFFDGAGGSVLRDDMVLPVGAREAVTSEAMLPRAIIEPLMIGGKPMLVPVMAFDVTYHWDGDADAFGQGAGSFVLGRESGAGGSDKLAPLPLDRASYAVDRPGARATAVGRNQ